MSSSMIEARGVAKAFGSTQALAGVDLDVPQGTVLGLLGPNGAGKTTLVRVLATLLRPDAGTARVAGIDVLADPQAARTVIGLAGQYAAVDELLTGRENLEMVGRLYGLGKAGARERSQQALERLSLTDAADRPVRTYSGGMRRRLDLGASLVGQPSVLILDEPTTGLDPRTRLELWGFLEDLVRDGTTVLLTTQYLEEADRLADRIVVIDQGSVIAEGSSDELKERQGGDVLDVKVEDPARLAELAGALSSLAGPPQIDVDEGRVLVPIGRRRSVDVLLEAGRIVDDRGIALDDLGIRRPSLDDVFLALTGRTTAEPSDEDSAAPGRRSRKAAA
jgi:ABC-2 type transport system ATP-binding protein